MLSNSFKWKHFVGEIILLNVRWYLKYPLSYRNLKEMIIKRGIQVDHSTIMRWVHQYSPEIENNIQKNFFYKFVEQEVVVRLLNKLLFSV
jgi:transposase-like protein